MSNTIYDPQTDTDVTIGPGAARTHKTGYHVWAHGKRSWHRTIAGAKRRLYRQLGWCSDAHIVDVATGARVRCGYDPASR